MVTAARIDAVDGDAGVPWGVHAATTPLAHPLCHPVVRRPAVLRRLQAAEVRRVVTLVAPAGYGKTTVLRDWADHDLRPFAWVTLDHRHDDAGRLLVAVARAVDAAVGNAGETPFVLVLDDADAIAAPHAVSALRAMATELPPGATLALASRREPPLPLARMRAEDAVVELGPRDLAMTRHEAAALLRGSGHELDRRDVDALVHLTEGWPVGLSLAARFLDEWGADGDLRRFSGADRLVTRYVRDEIVATLPSEWSDVLVRTSVLEWLTAPLCDAVLGRAGSGGVLSGLAGAGLLVPLDRTEERFRHHRLIAAALRARLRRFAPDAEAALHRRAGDWHARSGDVDGAVRHALLAGDVPAAAGHVWANLADAFAQGRITALERRLGAFSPAQIAAEPPLALAAGLGALMRGQGHLVEHWATAARAGAGRAGGRTARDVTVGVSVLRAAMGADGPERMHAEAEGLLRTLPHASPWRPLCCLVAGAAARALGSLADAARRLEDGARRAAISAPHVHALSLAELAVVALEQEDWEAAETAVVRARRQVDRHGLVEYPTAALVFAASAVVRAQRGRIDGGHDDLQEAVRLRAALSDFAPWYEAEVGILVARAAVRLSDAGLAREHLARSERLVRGLPGAAGLRLSAEDAGERLRSLTAAGSAPPASMTAAELRILRFLPTHLSFREIGERTFVSANTVKTQANAVYRKLDVSCRSDAVARARACGLLDG